MPYSIVTKDGIRINNIPDDIERDSQVLKDRVAAARAQRQQTQGTPSPNVPVVGAEPTPTAPDLFSGQTLQLGPLDTGVPISPEVTQFLAGAGGRLSDVPLALQSIRERLALGGDAAAISAEVERKRQIDQALQATTAGQLGGIAGDIAVGLPLEVQVWLALLPVARLWN